MSDESEPSASISRADLERAASAISYRVHARSGDRLCAMKQKANAEDRAAIKRLLKQLSRSTP